MEAFKTKCKRGLGQMVICLDCVCVGGGGIKESGGGLEFWGKPEAKLYPQVVVVTSLHGQSDVCWVCECIL